MFLRWYTVKTIMAGEINLLANNIILHAYMYLSFTCIQVWWHRREAYCFATAWYWGTAWWLSDGCMTFWVIVSNLFSGNKHNHKFTAPSVSQQHLSCTTTGHIFENNSQGMKLLPSILHPASAMNGLLTLAILTIPIQGHPHVPDLDRVCHFLWLKFAEARTRPVRKMLCKLTSQKRCPGASNQESTFTILESAKTLLRKLRRWIVFGY